MSFFHKANKKDFPLSKNFFFAGTLFVVSINFFVYFFCNTPNELISQNNWNSVLSFKNLLVHFISAFKHSNLQHLLLNSLCFLIAGGYVERKYGSIGLLFLVFIFTLFGESMVTANHSGTGGRGFSGVNYSFYAYIIVDFIFTIKDIRQDKIELILSLIILGLIYLACCFCGGTETIAFKFYPYDLIHNLGHYTAFLSGLILSLLIKLCRIKI